jgi:hypothetical protein
MNLTVVDHDCWILNTRTRMPFRYGIAELTVVPHLMVRVTVESGGRHATGVAADNLAPKWFTKDPQESFAHELECFFDVIAHALDFARGRTAASVFELWHGLYESQSRWAATTAHPPLLWSFGVSLVERAIIDAFCKLTGRTFGQTLRENTLASRSVRSTPRSAPPRRPICFRRRDTLGGPSHGGPLRPAH